MSKTIGLVIASHGALACALVESADAILGEPCGIVPVSVDTDADAFVAVTAAVQEADLGAGVLVLADLFGGSAANLALAQLDRRVEVVTGANLAMVLEAQQNRGLSLSDLASRVARAAKSSVIVASSLLSSDAQVTA